MHINGEVERLKSEKPSLVLLPDESLNAETPLPLLKNALTPVDAFFVRNNGRMPFDEPPATWSLTVDGHVDHPREFTLSALRDTFETVTVTAVLECAGNGRAGFDPATDGLAWGRGAVGCARWTGVRMRDVLNACGICAEAVYTGHHSPDLAQDGSGPAISRGLPINRALAPETLIAWAMNDVDLALHHGAPLRVVAPGAPGSAWQKWLSRIEVRHRVHDGEKMNGTDYRLPNKPVQPGEPLDPAIFEVIERMPVNTLITSPNEDARLRVGDPIHVTGFAWSGEGSITKVHVSKDEGRTWVEAELEPEGHRYAWRGFETTLRCDGGETAIIARAEDASGAVQPLGQAIWNPRGYCNNAAHRINVQPIR
ncbi:sulfite oxidase [Tianweitania sp. BSSL-BM11]|uniref:Sulfite oxidase n=1 Tax=Tianweitania aestuarii TaxID=2814886 RepID=A0ABS5RVL4_9HYPH|nr:sulfite oxidase [Tianweitania aestuarii]MBS9720254.1 sulfite oxidase [Tianweitania aestuarii]